jgi:hypothetical protein
VPARTDVSCPTERSLQTDDSPKVVKSGRPGRATARVPNRAARACPVSVSTKEAG